MEIGLSQVEHWIYGAEGNATVVLRYVGDNPHFVSLLFVITTVPDTNNI